MRILKKIRHTFGGHGVSVAITKVENQTPGAALFPISDTVMKFHVEIKGKREVEIREHRFQVYLNYRDKDILVAEELVDQDTEIYGAPDTLPYTLIPGEPRKDNCCIIDVDVESALKKLKISSAQALREDCPVRFFVRFTAVVKGTLVDPDSESDFTLIPAGG